MCSQAKTEVPAGKFSTKTWTPFVKLLEIEYDLKLTVRRHDKGYGTVMDSRISSSVEKSVILGVVFSVCIYRKWSVFH